jgi:hypothetical protein
MISKAEKESLVRLIADRMPDFEVKTCIMLGKDIRCSGLPTNKDVPQDFSGIENNKAYKVVVPLYEESARLNHIRRLRRAINRNGKPGVLKYLKQYMNPEELKVMEQWLDMQ